MARRPPRARAGRARRDPHRRVVDTRAAERVGDTVVATVDGELAGFVMVVGDEVEQVYVAAAHRGSGVAAALLTEAERLVAAGGHDRAWLAVAVGNERARRFYAKQGWVDEGVFDYPAAAFVGTAPRRRPGQGASDPTGRR